MVILEINQETLPMKSHYFLFNAGIAPLVPYLPTYAKQLGFSPYMLGLLYLILPILGLIAKPLFGAIGDRYERHKTIFIVFQILTVASFSGLYFIPESPPTPLVNLSCGNGETFFSTCFKKASHIDDCAISLMATDSSTAVCQMDCAMNTPLMWQIVCEYWNMPEYCYEKKTELEFEAKIYKQNITVTKDCAYFPINNVILPPALTYKPRCINNTIPNLEAKCELYCSDKRIDRLITSNGALSKPLVNLLCQNDSTYFNTCSHPSDVLQDFLKKFDNETYDADCHAICVMDEASKWLEMCVKWGADESLACRPADTIHLPDRLSFTGLVPMNKTIQEEECMYFKLHATLLPNGHMEYPFCPSGPAYNKSHFHSQCKIFCESKLVNEFLSSTMSPEEYKQNFSYNYVWIFAILMSLNWIGMAVITSVADAICFQILGSKRSDFGLQRLWGSVGWGIVSFVAGFLIDYFSHESGYKNYASAFLLMLVFLTANIFVTSWKLKYKQNHISIKIVRNIGLVFSSTQTIHFFLWVMTVGMCTGVLWQFLFWYLEDLARVYGCEQVYWIKTLQGLVSGIQCFCGEIPFFFFSGPILKKIGHLNSMTLVLIGFGIRFTLYSVLTNPWWVLPIELIQGLTYGMLYTTMASYASIVAPKGAEATMQGLVGAAFEGLGASSGSYIGGYLYGQLGGPNMFRVFAIIASLMGLLNILAQVTFWRRLGIVRTEENSCIIRYAAPTDAIEMTNDADTATQH